MTQRPKPPAKKAAAPVGLLPRAGMTVRLKNYPDEMPGTVVESDDWWDTLLIRGVDISEQTLVEWQRSGQPVRRWERTSQLEQVPAPS
jgi:hypothetical protein